MLKEALWRRGKTIDQKLRTTQERMSIKDREVKLK